MTSRHNVAFRRAWMLAGRVGVVVLLVVSDARPATAQGAASPPASVGVLDEAHDASPPADPPAAPHVEKGSIAWRSLVRDSTLLLVVQQAYRISFEDGT